MANFMQIVVNHTETIENIMAMAIESTAKRCPRVQAQEYHAGNTCARPRTRSESASTCKNRKHEQRHKSRRHNWLQEH